MLEFSMHVWHFLTRIWDAALQGHGRTLLALLSPILVRGLEILIKWHKGKFKMSSLKLTFKNNRIAIISGAIVYGVLLLYFTGNVVYKDHQALVSRIAGFEKNISDLKNDIHDRDIAIQQLKERIATAVVPKPVNLTGILQLWAFCPFHFTRTLFPFLSERPPGSPSPAALTL